VHQHLLRSYLEVIVLAFNLAISLLGFSEGFRRFVLGFGGLLLASLSHIMA